MSCSMNLAYGESSRKRYKQQLGVPSLPGGRSAGNGELGPVESYSALANTTL